MEPRPIRVAVIDYGAGNLHSLVKALEICGAEVCGGESGAVVERGRVSVSVETHPSAILSADAVVLPGVGAFGPAAAMLAPFGEALRDRLFSGVPCLGICLGMQLLFERSEEGEGTGLGVVRGRVRRLRAPRVPHMGWNTAEASALDRTAAGTSATALDPLFATNPTLLAYYANSFVAEPTDSTDVIAWTEYDGERFPAAVRRGRTWGVQFHPEKSGRAGLGLIRGFLAEVAS